MSLIRLNTQPTARDLRIFSTLWLIFCGGAGAVAWQKGAVGVASALWTLAAVGGVAGWSFPSAMRHVYLAALYASWPLGFVVSYVLLGAVYYLVLTPTGLIMRLFRHDPLERRFEPQKKTYWKTRGARPPAPSYFRQH